jgi:hypothetical protein
MNYIAGYRQKADKNGQAAPNRNLAAAERGRAALPDFYDRPGA